MDSLWVVVACILNEVNHGCYAFFVWNICVQGRDISYEQEGIGGRGGGFSIRLRKCFVSLMCGGRVLEKGWMKWLI